MRAVPAAPPRRVRRAGRAVRRGEIYRTQERIAERGDKPGFYVVVSRNFIGENTDISTVICDQAKATSTIARTRGAQAP